MKGEKKQSFGLFIVTMGLGWFLFGIFLSFTENDFGYFAVGGVLLIVLCFLAGIVYGLERVGLLPN